MKCPECLGPAGFEYGCDDPRRFDRQPIGQYHCPGCGVMQLAGFAHLVCDECGGTGEVPEPQVLP